MIICLLSEPRPSPGQPISPDGPFQARPGRQGIKGKRGPAEDWKANSFCFVMNSFQVKVHFVHAEGPIPLSDQFTCAEDERTDQIRELVIKVLKPETQNCLGPKLEVTRQKEAPHCEKLHGKGAGGNTPLLALSLDHREDCQGPWTGQVTSLGAFQLLAPVNISLPHLPPRESFRAHTHLPHLPVQKPAGRLDQ